MLPAIAHEPSVRLGDIAAACRITERTAQRIVSDLEEAGYLSRARDGRRTQYDLHLDGALRHPAEAHLPEIPLYELPSNVNSTVHESPNLCPAAPTPE
ncbi:helix-turn-helix transcriptional regulator [Streptomyces sp. HUAS ZL42]|uniref:helix-turn-helix transcriptional regulator n=1 Tax=Streptomyces sp. HUAS ZL42 TaxID=3231715 RepID=UPI00345EA1FA